MRTKIPLPAVPISRARLVFATLFLAFLFFSPHSPGAPKPAYGHLDIRTNRWTRIQVDGKDMGYAPINVELMVGPHQLHWVAAKEEGMLLINVVAKETCRLSEAELHH